MSECTRGVGAGGVGAGGKSGDRAGARGAGERGGQADRKHVSMSVDQFSPWGFPPSFFFETGDRETPEKTYKNI